VPAAESPHDETSATSHLEDLVSASVPVGLLRVQTVLPHSLRMAQVPEPKKKLKKLLG
jgi:hypothetical protein